MKATLYELDFDIQLFANGVTEATTENVNQNAQRKFDIGTEIAFLEPNANPFLWLMRRSVESLTDPEFKWSEDELPAAITAINNGAGYNSAATDLVVDDASIFTVRDLALLTATNELVYVTAVNAGTNTITVTRGYGTVAAAAILDNAEIVILSGASAEGDAIPAINQWSAQDFSNYAQIMRRPFRLTRTLDQTTLWTGKEGQRLRRTKGIQHAIQIERNLLLSQKSKRNVTDAYGNQTVLRTMDGLHAFVTDNIVDASGGFTELVLNQSCETWFAYGSEEKFLLAAPGVVTAINMFGINKQRVISGGTDRNGKKRLGLRVIAYDTPHGTLNIVKHRLMTGAVYGKTGFVIDPMNIRLRTLQATQLLPNRQNNGDDAKMWEYLTEMGLQVKLSKTHGRIDGVVAA